MKTTHTAKNMDAFLDMTKRVITAQMLKFQAGHQLFCPVCQTILDWQNLVSLDFKKVDPDGDLIYTKAVCGACFDRIQANLESARLEGERATGGPVALVTTDGRDFIDEQTMKPDKVAEKKVGRKPDNKVGKKPAATVAA